MYWQPVFAVFLLSAGAFSVAADSLTDRESDAAVAGSMKSWRKSAAERPRRIIFNNDGAEPIIHMRRPSVQDFLDERTSALAGSQVDSIFYCTRSSGFGLFTHFTEVGELFISQEGRYANNQIGALLKAGIDPLQVMVDFCKKNNIELFWSMRMNDTHDGIGANSPLIFRANNLKNDHPEYLIGTRDKRPQIGAWSAVNYSRPEIRDLAFRYVEEVCTKYDIDGVELDFFRSLVFFSSTSRGEKSTKEEREAMTELMARIRKMADNVGQSRGRPILIAVRLPDSVEYCHDMGLDLEYWLENDLLDLLITSGYFQLNYWDYSVALGRKHGVKVYPSLDESRVRELKGASAHEMRNSYAAYRGRAANVWAAGADGVYLFNFFDPHADILRELGSPQDLEKLDRYFFSAVRGVRDAHASAGNFPYGPYLKTETLNPADPKYIQPGGMEKAVIYVGATSNQLEVAECELRLQFDRPTTSEHLSVDLNGVPLVSVGADGRWLEYTNVADALRKGVNNVEVTLSAESSEQLVWTDLLIEVRPRD